MDPADWHAVVDVHLNGHFNICRSAINLFREQEYGRIIMVGSTSGLLGNIGQANCCAAKMGLVAFARILAMESASKNITANVIAPSADTRMTRSVPTPKDPMPPPFERNDFAAAEPMQSPRFVFISPHRVVVM